MLELLECRQPVEAYQYGNGNMETLKRFHAQNDEGRGGDRSHEHTQL